MTLTPLKLAHYNRSVVGWYGCFFATLRALCCSIKIEKLWTISNNNVSITNKIYNRAASEGLPPLHIPHCVARANWGVKTHYFKLVFSSILWSFAFSFIIQYFRGTQHRSFCPMVVATLEETEGPSTALHPAGPAGVSALGGGRDGCGRVPAAWSGARGSRPLKIYNI